MHTSGATPTADMRQEQPNGKDRCGILCGMQLYKNVAVGMYFGRIFHYVTGYDKTAILAHDFKRRSYARRRSFRILLRLVEP